MRSVLGEPVKIQQCACNCQLPATRLIQFTQQTSAKTIIGKVRLCKIYIDSAQIGSEQWSGEKIDIDVVDRWVVYSLPNDSLSIELGTHHDMPRAPTISLSIFVKLRNAIIIDRSRRWPLMIDPQRQVETFFHIFSILYDTFHMISLFWLPF